jgi:hypothetical protein
MQLPGINFMQLLEIKFYATFKIQNSKTTKTQTFANSGKFPIPVLILAKFGEWSSVSRS